MTTAEAFQALRHALEQAGIRYAVGGSWASTAFGEPRFTNDIDVLADLNHANLGEFLKALPPSFYADLDEAGKALQYNRPFNVIEMGGALKFDIFPASGYPLGQKELDRAVLLASTGLSETPAPFVTPEDILLAKLHWFRLGGEVSEVQWRDIQGLVSANSATFDLVYLNDGAQILGIPILLERALNQAES